MSRSLEGPADSWSDGAVTPSDETTYVSPRPRGFVVLTNGNVTIEDQQGNALSWTGLTVSAEIYWYRVHKVMAATTADVALVY